jgi:hypothetical protein
VTVHTERKMKQNLTGERTHIVTDPEDKMYRISFFKTRRLSDNTSVLFGYI